MLWSVLGVLATLWTCTTAVHQEIVVAPERQLVPFNLNDTVPFQCVVEGDNLIWQVAGIQLNTPDRLNRANMSGIFVEGPAINATHLSSRLLIFVNDDLSDVDNSRNNTGVKCIAEGETVFDSVQSDEVFLITFSFPDPPSNLRLTVNSISPEGNLTVQWDPPTNLPPDVFTFYRVSISHLDNGQNYPGFPVTVHQTYVIVQEGLLVNCTPYEFAVVSENSAGQSSAVSINDTIPISPNVIPVSDSLPNGTTLSFDQSGNPVISLIFEPAITCSTNFPVRSYDILITGEGLDATVTVSNSSVSGDVIALSLTGSNVPGMRGDTLYTIRVRVCSVYICRDSEPVQIATTAIASNRVLYTEGDNRVYLSCAFIASSTASGCAFRFTLRNDSEVFNVTRDDPSSSTASRCAVTENHTPSYDSVEVLGLGGGALAFPAALQPDDGADSTDGADSVDDRCPEAEDESDGLSDAAIFGIVAGAVLAALLVAVILAVVIAVCCYYRKVVMDVKWAMVRRHLGGSTDSVIELESAQSTPVLSRHGQPQTVPTQREKFKHKRVGTGILSRKQGLKFQFEPQKLQSLKRHCKSCRPEDEVCLNLYCELQPERRREDGGGTQESNP